MLLLIKWRRLRPVFEESVTRIWMEFQSLTSRYICVCFPSYYKLLNSNFLAVSQEFIEWF